jgi:cytochrome P450/NADPH-cytochrome P450 reductase
LDTISLCAFHYRFNNFYRQDTIPSLTQWYAIDVHLLTPQVDGLRQSGSRARRFNILKPLYRHENAKFEAATKYMFEVADTIIAERKKAGPEGKKNDLLQKMLDGIDPVSREGLSNENIRYQMITFLIAGYQSRLRP